MKRASGFVISAFMLMVSGVANTEGVQEIVMNAKSYSFSPDRLTVQVGVPVEIRMKKTGWAPHTFVIDDPASGLNIETKLRSSKLTVIQFTPQRKGQFVFYCGKKLPFGKSHREKGMHGILEVK